MLDQKTGEVILYQDGLTTQPHPLREIQYSAETINGRPGGYKRVFKSRPGKPMQIYAYIYDYLTENWLMTDDQINALSEGELLDYIHFVGGTNRYPKFNFKITGVFGGRDLLRRAEKDHIFVGRWDPSQTEILQWAMDEYKTNKVGLGTKLKEVLKMYGIDESLINKGLNDISAGGKCPEKGSRAYIVWMIYYTAMGYSVREMHEKLVKRGLYKNKLSRFKNEYHFLFGGLKKGRKMFLDPVKSELQRVGYTSQEINLAYPAPEIDIDRLIELGSSRFYEEEEIAHKLGLSRGEFQIRIPKVIREDFPECPLYYDVKKEERSWNDLRLYLLAPQVLDAAYNGKSAKEIQDKFGIKRYYLNTIIKKGLHYDSGAFDDLKGNVRLHTLYEALLRNPADIEELLQDSEIVKVYPKTKSQLTDSLIADIKKYFINNPDFDYVNNFKMVKIAVVAPILLELYREYGVNRILNDQSIIQNSRLKDFFSSKAEILDYLYSILILSYSTNNRFILTERGIERVDLSVLEDPNFLGSEFHGINPYYLIY